MAFISNVITITDIDNLIYTSIEFLNMKNKISNFTRKDWTNKLKLLLYLSDYPYKSLSEEPNINSVLYDLEDIINKLSHSDIRQCIKDLKYFIDQHLLYENEVDEYYLLNLYFIPELTNIIMAKIPPEPEIEQNEYEYEYEEQLVCSGPYSEDLSRCFGLCCN